MEDLDIELFYDIKALYRSFSNLLANLPCEWRKMQVKVRMKYRSIVYK